MRKIESEKLLEKKLREGVKKLGGLALKFTCISFTGVPDRVIFMPGGKFRFAEIKTTGKPLKPRQKIVFPMLEKLGFPVPIIDTTEKLNNFLNELIS